MSRDDLMATARVGAALLLRGPFPSLYVFAVQGDSAKFQCDDVVEGRVRARAWGLTSYRHYVAANGREFHVWSGAVDGSGVEIVAAPDTPVGPVPPDDADPLEQLASGVST